MLLTLSTLNGWELKCLYEELGEKQLEVSNNISKAENKHMREIHEKQCDSIMSDIISIKRELERR